MALYKVEFKKSARKEFEKLPKDIQSKVIESIGFLSQNPYSEILPIKKLKGPLSVYRLRIGNYRLVYEVKNKLLVIIVIKIGHRKDVYRKR